MNKSSFLRKASSLGAAALVGFGLTLSSAPVVSANPAPQLPVPSVSQLAGMLPNSSTPPAGAQQIVTFGDSFTAAGGTALGEAPQLENGYQFKPTCAKDKRNWPHSAAAAAGKSLADWSCNGTGGMIPLFEVQAYVEQAIAAGNIGPGTEKVVFMYGGLDPIQWVDAAAGLQAAGNIPESEFTRMYGAIKNRVAQAAPGAQVVVASYPELVTDDKLCAVNGLNQTIPVPAPGGNRIENGLRDSIKHAAQVNGLQFIDVLELTRGHGTCNPDPAQRFVTGMVDTDAPHTMPMHPTVVGGIEIGKIIAKELYR
ncbi:esterase [Corynebacterium sp. sy017]|uniref:GDSL-type esterase/lipase family protein n=1 Tax=unclassified Corynebacterium TaxID=2624378 RepID=UPI001185F8EA|nr:MULTISPECIES: GDSL-type esterase/lipase family protein [unclassified Corynebacterium]MBP3088853.1 esterase [Corynebacterium sp. sy017]TSD91195.1 esterase [Corynebacterium sp. SY003]